MLEAIWRYLKLQRKVWLGPVSMVFRFERTVRITPGSMGQLVPAGAYPAAAGARHEFNAPPAAGTSPPPGVPHAPGGSHADPAPAAAPAASPSGPGTAVIVGVGPGFGYALARRLAAEGFEVVMVVRNADRLKPLEAELRARGGRTASLGCDATDERSVEQLFSRIVAAHGVPSLVVYSLQEFGPGKTLDIEAPAFESGWRHNCLGAFLVSRAAGRAMLAQAAGSIVLVGSTSSIIGREAHLNLAVGKFGQRALAQVLARELWPQGIHVAHVMVDADIAEQSPPVEDFPQSDPEHIAQSIVALHRQPRSAWTSEMDLRPWNEVFWEHC